MNKEELVYLFYDIMRDYVWPFYHRWFIHKGRLPNWLVDHCQNPFYILTPRLLERQINNSKNVEV